jgi:multidrug efflux system membrane fusion protein
VTDGMDRLSDGAKIRISQPHPAGASSAGAPATAHGGKHAHAAASTSS